jgi:hypothetical protein
MGVRLNNNEDVFRWKLHQHGQYSIHSLYLALINNGRVERNKTLWRLKIPLKKIMLYMHKEVVPIKDNLTRQHWKGSKKYNFYLHDESIQHHFMVDIM